MDALICIAEALKISLDVLLDINIDAKPHKTVILSPEERTLLKQYRRLDDYGQRMVDTVCRMEYARTEESRKQKPAPNVVELHPNVKRDRFIPHYSTPAAAGTSVPLDGTDFEMILVDDSVPAQADYAVNIQGDSMYPYIKDGDMVYVQKDVELSIGDVGIWCVDGAMYCKQYYIDEERNLTLVSANPELSYTNVYVSADCGSSVKLCGKVLLGRKIGLPDYLFEE